MAHYGTTNLNPFHFLIGEVETLLRIRMHKKMGVTSYWLPPVTPPGFKPGTS